MDETASPRILPRTEHPISRKNIDPDALKVLYRLHNHGFMAYLVGGCVRDLLLKMESTAVVSSGGASGALVGNPTMQM